MTDLEVREAQMFFRLSSELAAAQRAMDEESVKYALWEMVSVWLRVTNVKIRARYEAILDANDMGAEMDDLCEQEAR